MILAAAITATSDFNLCENDDATHEATVQEINSEDCADFLFVIYEHTDFTGHDKGFTFNNPACKEAFVAEDTCGAQVIDTIKSRKIMKKRIG